MRSGLQAAIRFQLSTGRVLENIEQERFMVSLRKTDE
jgi:hypothetical protein